MRTARARISRTVCLFLVVLASSVDAGPVSGTVGTQTKPGVTPATAVVYAESMDGPNPRRPTTVKLTQKNKTFQPRLLTVSTGSTVEFPNNDLIFHNVFSLSGPQPFDLGLYRGGDSLSRTFTAPGTYRVFCNIHPQMTALIVVLPTPYSVLAGPDGRFALDLPPGRYRLTALSERAAPVSAEVTSASGATDAPGLTLNESQWVLAQHKNKFGQEYPKAAYQR